MTIVIHNLTRRRGGDKTARSDARQRFPNAPDEFFVKPAAIAEEVWHVAHQDRSAWSFNVELRPFRETW